MKRFSAPRRSAENDAIAVEIGYGPCGCLFGAGRNLGSDADVPQTANAVRDRRIAVSYLAARPVADKHSDAYMATITAAAPSLIRL